MSDQAESRLRDLLRELAKADAQDLVQEAREGARARAKAMLENALVDELLAAAASGQEHPVRPVRTAAPETSSSSTGPGSIGQSGDAWWAYCVVSADHSQIASELEGIEPGTRVEAVVEGGLAALVSPVPLTEYGDERLRQHLEDIEWLERTARCHEAVLEQVMERASIVPLRLCTLYHDRDGIRRMLLQHAEGLAGSLAAVEGTAEWGVKVFLEAEPGGPAASVQAAEQPERPATGTGYLAQRQQERQAARLRDEISQECVEEVHGVMCDVARDARLNAVQRPEAHGREGEMLLNGAYLVDREQESGLSSAVAQLQSRWSARGFAVELTGPWPPYNFVSESAGMIS